MKAVHDWKFFGMRVDGSEAFACRFCGQIKGHEKGERCESLAYHRALQALEVLREPRKRRKVTNYYWARSSAGVYLNNKFVRVGHLGAYCPGNGSVPHGY